MSMLDKLKGLVGKSPDKAKKGVDKATSFIDEKTGGKYSDKIDQASEKAHTFIDDSQGSQGEQASGEGDPGDGQQRQ